MASIFVLFALTCVASLPAQTTPPKPDSELAVSREEYQRRLEALQQKAASQPTTARATIPPAVNRRVIDTAAGQARAELVGQAAVDRAAARKERAQIDWKISQIDSRGRALENHRAKLLWQMDEEIAAANRTESYSDIQGSVGSDLVRGSVTTTGNNPVAVQMAKARYDAALAPLEQEVASLYQEKQALLPRRAELLDIEQRGVWRATIAADHAQQRIETVVATQQRQQQPAADAAWEQARAKYPGVDVVAIWNQAVIDAGAMLGQDKSQLEGAANALFNERATQAMKQTPQ